MNISRLQAFSVVIILFGVALIGGIIQRIDGLGIFSIIFGMIFITYIFFPTSQTQIPDTPPGDSGGGPTSIIKKDEIGKNLNDFINIFLKKLTPEIALKILPLIINTISRDQEKRDALLAVLRMQVGIIENPSVRPPPKTIEP
ncbi:MAG: hypothetical protein U1E78_12845 [Gammaproteobacteria bacterium]